MPPTQKRGLLLGAALLVIVLGAVFAFFAWRNRVSDNVRNGQYAVFLTNGQVYFGNITHEDSQSLVLKSIYYIQFKGDQKDVLADQSDVSLLKLGNELHGPEDWMEISRSAILFIERLKSDGNVAKAIESYTQK